MEVNGERVYFPNGRAQMVGGRVLVPLRGVMEQMGAYVTWDADSRLVTARREIPTSKCESAIEPLV